jgi:hypothetical protein
MKRDIRHFRGYILCVLILSILYCSPSALGATYNATGVWRYSTSNHWSTCPEGPGAPGTRFTAIAQNRNTFRFVDVNGIHRGKVSDAIYTCIISYPEDEGTATESIVFTLSSDISGAGTVTWTWTDGEYSCSGGSDISLTRMPAVATYNATGIWRYSTSNHWSTCPEGPEAPETRIIAVTQNRNTFRFVGYKGIQAGLLSGATYTCLISYPQDDGTTTESIVFTLTSDTSGSGATRWTWTDGEYSCSGGYRISLEKVQIPNNPPDKPTLSLPENGATNVSLTPILRTGSFSDPDRGAGHRQTEWEISTEDDFSSTVLTTTLAARLTSLIVPRFVLVGGTTYYWRVRFYDNYLIASEWSDPYSFTTRAVVIDQNGNGIPDKQENAAVDLDGDGTPDIGQGDIKSLDTEVGDGQIGVSIKGSVNVTSIDSIESLDQRTISEIARPYYMPLGLCTIGLTVDYPGDTAMVTVYFSEAAPAGAKWYLYDSTKGWMDYSRLARFGADRKSVSIRLKDWGYGDNDGIANGVIVDPGGFGLASWVEGLVSDASTGEGIARAEVTISDLALNADLTGNYLSMILPGTYPITVSAEGYEPVTYSTVEVLEGETLTLDVALAPSSQGTSLYFPHVDTNSPWETEIAIINTSTDQSVGGTLRAYSNAGQELQDMAISLSPHARRQITVSDEFTASGSIGYLIFDADSNTACGYTKFYQQGTFRVAVPAVKEVNTSDIYLSHIDSSSSWWTGVSLLNTTSSAKTLSIDFDNGQRKSIALAPGEHQAFSIRDLFEGQAQEDIHSAVITNASGVVGLELFGSGTQLSGILVKDDTATTLYYPHIASDEEWWTGIVAFNPSSSSSSITITPYTEEGAPLATQELAIAPGGKYIGTVAGLDLPPGTAWFTIDSTSAITGFELFGTNNGNQLAGYTGVGIIGKQGVFAKVEENGWTGIAFVNIEDAAASVTLTAYDTYGIGVATRILSLGGHSKVVQLAQEIFGQDISAATYIGYSSNKELVGFQLNGSSNGMMLDALPGM